ncbi:MFS transporter OS=Streptomyces tendae OX=1932 GN=GUR47_18785 PE=4 SV=1 [Streptomyces tendae]
MVGGVLMTVGLFLLSTMDTDTTRFTSGLYMAVVGLGMGCLMQITMLVAQQRWMKDMGVASSSTTLFRTLGSSFGVAIMGALFDLGCGSRTSWPSGPLASGAQATEQSATVTADALNALPATVRDAYQHAASGTHGAFLLGSVVAVLALVAAVFVKEVPLKGAGPKAADAPADDGDDPATAKAPVPEAV